MAIQDKVLRQQALYRTDRAVRKFRADAGLSLQLQACVNWRSQDLESEDPFRSDKFADCFDAAWSAVDVALKEILAGAAEYDSLASIDPWHESERLGQAWKDVGTQASGPNAKIEIWALAMARMLTVAESLEEAISPTNRAKLRDAVDAVIGGTN